MRIGGGGITEYEAAEINCRNAKDNLCMKIMTDTTLPRMQSKKSGEPKGAKVGKETKSIPTKSLTKKGPDHVDQL